MLKASLLHASKRGVIARRAEDPGISSFLPHSLGDEPHGLPVISASTLRDRSPAVEKDHAVRRWRVYLGVQFLEEKSVECRHPGKMQEGSICIHQPKPYRVSVAQA